MIHLVLGFQGCGKTVYSVMRAILAQAQGKTIYLFVPLIRNYLIVFEIYNYMILFLFARRLLTFKLRYKVK